MTALIFNDVTIGNRDDMLSLTDMWRAAGEPKGKRPANWTRKEGAPFIEAVALTLNVPVGHILVTERGRSGATYAHWQIGLAYAKYLSAEFHMFCNTKVRDYMEGRLAPAPVAAASAEDQLRARYDRDWSIMTLPQKYAAVGEMRRMCGPHAAREFAAARYLPMPAAHLWRTPDDDEAAREAFIREHFRFHPESFEVKVQRRYPDDGAVFSPRHRAIGQPEGFGMRWGDKRWVYEDQNDDGSERREDDL